VYANKERELIRARFGKSATECSTDALNWQRKGVGEEVQWLPRRRTMYAVFGTGSNG